MTKKKTEETPNLLREPKAKRRLGLSVPKLIMPHEELFQSKVIQFDTNLDSQKFDNLDSQSSKQVDSQDSHNWIAKGAKTGNPDFPNLDSQKQETGNPNPTNLDSLISVSDSRIAKEEIVLDSRIAKSNNLDIPKAKKQTETGKWAKYDKNRVNRKGIFLRTNDELTKQFKQFCIKHDLEFAQGTELAWTKFMESLDSQTSQSLDSLIAHNNKQLKMMWKTKPLIINLYYAYNQFFTSKVKWTAKDDLTGQKFNEVDPRVIELGILQTQANLFTEGNQKTTINGFLYYANEINRFAIYEENPEMLDAILKINRSNWEKITGKTVDLTFLDK